MTQISIMHFRGKDISSIPEINTSDKLCNGYISVDAQDLGKYLLDLSTKYDIMLTWKEQKREFNIFLDDLKGNFKAR